MIGLKTSFKSLFLYDYTDALSYLNAYVKMRKANSDRWSLSIWARKLGFSDLSTLTNVLKGRRIPSVELEEKFALYFEFSEPQQQYWKLLLEKARMKTMSSDLELQMDAKIGSMRILATRKNTPAPEPQSGSLLYSILAREVLRLTDSAEADPLTKINFLGDLDLRVLKSALKELIKSEELKIDSEGNLRPAESYTYAGDGTPNEKIKQFHEGSCDRAKTAVRLFDVDHRYFSGNIVSIREKDLPKLKDFCADLEMQFVSAAESKDADSLYQLNLQLFPIAKVNHE